MAHWRRFLILVSCLGWIPTLAVAAAPSGGPSSVPAGRGLARDAAPLAVQPALAYRRDLVIVRLGSEASSMLRDRDRGGPEAFGATDLGRAVAGLSGAWLEPEFKGEAPAGRSVAGRLRPSDLSDLSDFWIIHVPESAGIDRALSTLGTLAEVDTVFTVAIVPGLSVPNDSLWSAAYYFQQPSRRDLHAPEAWDITRGDTSIVVGIVDTGVLPTHPDLSGQFWTNWAERNGAPGVDDDGNGFVDDDHGWDFVDLPSTIHVRAGEDSVGPDNDPSDFAGHGTAVAGLIGARTNNRIGVAGTAWNVRLMPLRAAWSSYANPSGEGDVSYMAQAIRYATRMGVKIINCSFTTVNQPDLDAAVTAAVKAGVTIVVPSGNGQLNYLAQREDAISVTSTDGNDRVAGFATVGPTVDIAAPGVRLTTTVVDRDSFFNRLPDYTTGATGTSFSAPLVTGAVALIQSLQVARGQPLLNPLEARMRLMDTADDISDLNAGSPGYGSGRLNLYRAVTDPPTSRMALTSASLSGPGVVLPANPPPGRIVVATQRGDLIEMDGATGATLAVVHLPAAPIGGLAAADLGAGAGIGIFVATLDGRIRGFRPDLDPLPGWPVAATVSKDSKLREPTLGDLDGDGVLEVLWAGGHDGRLWAWYAEGRPVRGFPRRIDANGADLSIAVADLDQRPGVEIVVASSRGYVTALGGNGLELSGWPVAVATEFPPVVAELGASHTPTVICMWGSAINALGPNGAIRWMKVRPSYEVEAPAVADLDLDGSDEIVLLRSYPETMTVIDSAGRVFGPWAQGLSFTGVMVGPPLVGPVDTTQAPCILLPTQRGLLAYTGLAQPIRSFPKPGGGVLVSFLGDIDADGRTEVVAAPTTDSTLFIYDAGARSWNAGHAQWSTARGNFARTGSRVYAPGMTAIDNVPPNAIADLTAVANGPGSALLRWTSTGDPRGGPTLRYELRRSRVPLDDGNFFLADAVSGLPEPRSPGSAQNLIVSGLEENATYYFGMRCRGPSGTWSAISNVAVVSSQPIPPATISSLRGAATSDREVELQWIATGDDGTSGKPRAYLVRATESPIDEESFDGAPLAWEVAAQSSAGGLETARLSGLEPRHDYWFAVKAVDDAGNRSALSNLVEVTLSPILPATVDDLGITTTTDTSITLRWTATGEDGAVGQPRAYLVRAAESPLDSASFDRASFAWEFAPRVAAGEVESERLEGLPREHRYWIALLAVDHAGNRSRLSNSPETWIGRLALRRDQALVCDAQPSRAPVRLLWSARDASGGPRAVRIFDAGGRLVAAIGIGDGDHGALLWNGRDRSGHRLSPGLYFARLTIGGAASLARIVLLR